MAAGNDSTVAKGVQLFLQRIESKTGWGKNEIKELMLDCVMEAAAGEVRKKLDVGEKEE